VIEWLPTESVLVVKVAVPPDTVPVPSVVDPSRNVTVPVGVPAPGDTTATVAVNVTDCPNTDGLADEVRVVVVFALLTVWVRTALVLPEKLESPLYLAVIEWDPTASVDVANVATPPDSVPVPRVVVPSRKVTVPVGVPVAGGTGATVAVNVTDCPKTDGLAEDVTVVVVWPWAGGVTVWVRAALVLVLKFASPPYVAVIEKLPAWVNVAVNVAIPPESVPVPMLMVPLRKVTVPDGVPAPGDTAATVAVKVTAWPVDDGLGDDVRVVVVFALLTTCATAVLVLVLKLPSPP
jgi:hypothetical protein